jgi:hypothetical protein
MGGAAAAEKLGGPTAGNRIEGGCLHGPCRGVNPKTTAPGGVAPYLQVAGLGLHCGKYHGTGGMAPYNTTTAPLGRAPCERVRS